jgi:hypothetical protein
MTGYELKYSNLKNQARDREDKIKAKCAFKVETYEIALRELKFHMKKEIDHAMMAQNDAETKLHQMY